MRLIDADELQHEYMKYHDGKRSLLIDVAPTVEERKNGCEHCVDIGGWVKPIEKNGHAFVWHNHLGWRLTLKAKGWRGTALINFCPMCGRKLEGEEKNETD